MTTKKSQVKSPPPHRAPVIAAHAGQSAVLIQLQEKQRNAKGKLVFIRSKTLTVYNLTLEEIETRLRQSLTG